MLVDGHDTNSSPDGRFAQMAVKRSGRVFTSLFGVILRYFARPERMPSMYFALEHQRPRATHL